MKLGTLRVKLGTMRFGRLPEGLPFHHPAAFLSTWFGSGLMPLASGTWGSLAALPFAAAIAYFFDSDALVFASLLCCAVGVWSSQIYGERSGQSDPGAIVIDEVAGQWLTLAFVPLDPLWYLAGFLLFRLADIVKPWPANWADEKIDGGLGVMLDDMIAGFYAMVVLLLAHFAAARYGWV